jgi:hypothetical protein
MQVRAMFAAVIGGGRMPQGLGPSSPWRVSPPVALLNDVPLSCLCRLRRRQEKTDPLACLHVLMKGSHAQF